MGNTLRLGTRGSALALTQSKQVAECLRAAWPGLAVDLVTIVTRGDISQAANTPLSASGDKGIFAVEIERALLQNEIDIAVHSAKDLAAQLPAGLMIGAVPDRQDPRDAMVGHTLSELQSGAVVGTGSARRQAILRHLRPDLDVRDIRGNVDTRIKKQRDGEYDAIILAVAGLAQLDLTHHIAEILSQDTFVPDPSQGALAVECRDDDRSTMAYVAAIDNENARAEITAERSFLKAMGGGCTTPLGALARRDGDLLSLTVLTMNGTRPVVRHSSGFARNSYDLGWQAAKRT